MAYRWNGTVTKGTPGKANWTYNVGDPIFFGFFGASENNLDYSGYGYAFAGHKKLNENTSQKELEAFYNQMQEKNFFPATTYKTAVLVTSGTLDNVKGFKFYNNVNGVVGETKGVIKTIIRESKAFSSEYHVVSGKNMKFDTTKTYKIYTGFPFFDNKSEMDKWLLDGSSIPGSGSSSSTEAKGGYEGYLYLNGLTRYYKIDESNYAKIASAIRGGIFSGSIAEGIIDIKGVITPAALNTQATTTIFKDVQGNPITVQGQEYDFGTFKFNERFRNFLDYGESTSIKLYLPYCGMQTLDPSIVMGGNIRLKGVIDIISGNILYYLIISNSGLSTAATSVIYNWNGNVACELPIGAEDYGSKVSAIVTSTIQTAGSLAIAPTGVGAALGTASGLNNVASAVLSNKYVNVGSISSNNGMGGVQYPYILVTVPIPEYPANYGHTVGYPSMQYHALGSLSGYTKVDTVHLEGITGASEDEINEIETLLKKGVVL